jgi:hypothetical protein
MGDPATLIDRQIQLANFLVAGWPKLDIPGLPPISAAAAVGNATQENQCYSVTMGTLDHGSNGLFQWRDSTVPRLTNMQAFGVKWFGVWESIEAQAAYFSFDCKGNYKDLWADLIAGSKGLATLTANIMAIYEAPAAASAMLDARIKFSTVFMNAWTPTPIAMPVPQPLVVPMPTPLPSPPTLTTLSFANIVVIRALANAIVATNDAAVIAALIGAIMKELS